MQDASSPLIMEAEERITTMTVPEAQRIASSNDGPGSVEGMPPPLPCSAGQPVLLHSSEIGGGKESAANPPEAPAGSHPRKSWAPEWYHIGASPEDD